MAINNLKNYNWEQGTQASPVLLTGAEFSKITALIEESIKIGSSIHADIRGWIQVGQHITSYQLYLAQLAKDSQGNPLLHIVNPQVDPTQYTVAPQSSTINEGTSVKLNINGISLDALKFRITNHTNETPDYQARTTIDTQLGYIRVAPAQENTTWTDVVTIQCCPIWEEWDAQGASIVEFTVSVNAVAVTSATITAPSNVKPDITFYPIVNFLPVGHTKNIVNTLEDAGAKLGICFVPTSDNFIVGKTNDPSKMSAIAPNIETPVGQTWSLGCGIYAYSSSQTIATPTKNVNVKYPYIQFNVTTDGTLSDISTAKPSIVLQKIDNNNAPIGNPIVLDYDTYAVVSGSSILYTYGGGAIRGDGTEKFIVNVNSVPHYNEISTFAITPNGVDNIYNVEYVTIIPDCYFVFSDSTEQSYDDYVNNNNHFPYGKSKSDVVAIAFISEDYRCMIDPNEVPLNSIDWGYDGLGGSSNFAGIPYVNYYTQIETWGKENSQKIMAFHNSNGITQTTAVSYCASKYIMVGDIKCSGFLLSRKDSQQLFNSTNYNKFANMFIALNKSAPDILSDVSNYTYWTSQPGGYKGGGVDARNTAQGLMSDSIYSNVHFRAEDPLKVYPLFTYFKDENHDLYS